MGYHHDLETKESEVEGALILAVDWLLIIRSILCSVSIT